ncbi:hypothetical protein FHR83_001645 [Actinoplanes campanulatus]|uniref:N-acetyltransferase domain-containing protein n=1 Tax=Actinoplanes campanulatus TaxID=113559 RepID=A0A7W5AD77_9ACTN|nr:hypothetical protein [Actinoplanes campanulatus]MBB3093996.1 hypothetical protein [Actinoplanes campanulatus]GGN33386.1 hypothetical protein GCM10010109_55330 [Actinoplanes campanulatus]GID38308.1 hypothetical protein Aca09nite_48140 [Actinoplanes campanulatus]
MPITADDVRTVAEFLHVNLNNRVPVEDWVRAVDVPWKVDAPDHGRMLLDEDGAVAGALLAFYSEREIGGRTERFCNLGAWCVLPEHRFHSLRLLKALLAQPGYHFTDLSPSGNVVPINTRLGFTLLDTATALVPNLPWPAVPGRRRVTADPDRIRRGLTGPALARYLDHADAPAARHVLLTDGGESCLVIFRRDRRKGLPLFASILWVSDPALFRRMRRRLFSHLLLRHGVPLTLAELRVTGPRPALSRLLGSPRRKMFRSGSLGPDDIDYLYSELVSLNW